jgi:hypothetical protein
MDIKWVPAGDGPAPLPYSKRVRDAMGVKDQDLPPWHFEDGQAPGEARAAGGPSGGKHFFLVICVVAVALLVLRGRNRRRLMVGSTTSSSGVGDVAAFQPLSESEELKMSIARLKRFAAIEKPDKEEEEALRRRRRQEDSSILAPTARTAAASSKPKKTMTLKELQERGEEEKRMPNQHFGGDSTLFEG